MNSSAKGATSTTANRSSTRLLVWSCWVKLSLTLRPCGLEHHRQQIRQEGGEGQTAIMADATAISTIIRFIVAGIGHLLGDALSLEIAVDRDHRQDIGNPGQA